MTSGAEARRNVREPFHVELPTWRPLNLPCGHVVFVGHDRASASEEQDVPVVRFTWTDVVWRYQHAHVATLRKLGAALPPPNCKCYWLAAAVQHHVHRYSAAIDEYIERIAKDDRQASVAHRDVLMLLRRRSVARLAHDDVVLPFEMRLTTRVNTVVDRLVRRCSYSVVSPRRTVIVACLTRTPMVSLHRRVDPFFGATVDRDEDIQSVIRLGLPHGWLARTRHDGCIHEGQLVVDERDDARLLLVEHMQHLYLEWSPR